MRLLLDTHIYLWCLSLDSHLKKSIRSTISNADEVYVSSASIWEIAIKIKLGKIKLDINELIENIPGSGFLELPVTAKHAAVVSELPGYHNDPFDRILIAQSISEPLHFLTADKLLANYTDLVEII